MLSTYRLPSALPGEQIITIVHRDAFIAVKRVVFFMLLLALPIIIIAMFSFLFPALFEIVWFWPLLLLALSAYILFIWLLFFHALIDYFLDVWIITDHRIIDVAQEGFFSRSISEMRLDRAQDISSDVKGFFPTVFKFGNVIVQTASGQNRLFFEEVPNPEHIRDTLMKLTAKRETPKDSALGS